MAWTARPIAAAADRAAPATLIGGTPYGSAGRRIAMDRSSVVAGTDGSEVSMRAVEWAAREAVAHGRPLRIVSVPVLPRLWQRTPPGRPDTVAELVCAVADQALAAAAERAAEIEPGLSVSTSRLSGRPAQALAGAAADASLLVVGSRGAGGFAALVLGSVSRHVAFAAACPVVVVREETMAVHRQVVVGVGDLDRVAALGFAFEEASLRKARLQLVHAWEVFMPSPLLSGIGGPHGGTLNITSEATAWVAAQMAPWRQKYPDVEVLEDVVNGSPGRVLVGASARADLVILGRGNPQASGNNLWTGTVTHAVLNHAYCPVAVVPD
jgi:nucleotide-binding universal stress UspA family protein